MASFSPLATLESVLRDELAVSAFQRYLSSIMAEENLLFWMEVECFRFVSPRSLQLEANEVYRKFFDPESPLELNVEGSVMGVLDDAMTKQEATVDLFDAAQASVLRNMSGDTFPAFLRSPAYRQYTGDLETLARRAKDERRRHRVSTLLPGFRRSRSSTANTPSPGTTPGGGSGSYGGPPPAPVALGSRSAGNSGNLAVPNGPAPALVAMLGGGGDGGNQPRRATLHETGGLMTSGLAPPSPSVATTTSSDGGGGGGGGLVGAQQQQDDEATRLAAFSPYDPSEAQSEQRLRVMRVFYARVLQDYYALLLAMGGIKPLASATAADGGAGSVRDVVDARQGGGGGAGGGGRPRSINLGSSPPIGAGVGGGGGSVMGRASLSASPSARFTAADVEKRAQSLHAPAAPAGQAGGGGGPVGQAEQEEKEEEEEGLAGAIAAVAIGDTEGGGSGRAGVGGISAAGDALRALVYSSDEDAPPTAPRSSFFVAADPLNDIDDEVAGHFDDDDDDDADAAFVGGAAGAARGGGGGGGGGLSDVSGSSSDMSDYEGGGAKLSASPSPSSGTASAGSVSPALPRRDGGALGVPFNAHSDDRGGGVGPPPPSMRPAASERRSHNHRSGSSSSSSSSRRDHGSSGGGQRSSSSSGRRRSSSQSRRPSSLRRSAHAEQHPMASARRRERSFLVRGWPHPTPTPADMARAGFYRTADKAGRTDRARCYRCKVTLSGWFEEDDPATEHAFHAPRCPLVQRRGWARPPPIPERPPPGSSSGIDSSAAAGNTAAAAAAAGAPVVDGEDLRRRFAHHHHVSFLGAPPGAPVSPAEAATTTTSSSTAAGGSPRRSSQQQRMRTSFSATSSSSSPLSARVAAGRGGDAEGGPLDTTSPRRRGHRRSRSTDGGRRAAAAGGVAGGGAALGAVGGGGDIAASHAPPTSAAAAAPSTTTTTSSSSPPVVGVPPKSPSLNAVRRRGGGGGVVAASGGNEAVVAAADSSSAPSSPREPWLRPGEEALFEHRCLVRGGRSRMFYGGRLVCTTERLEFVPSTTGVSKKTNKTLMWRDVTDVVRDRTARVIPDAITFHLASGKRYTFSGFSSRDAVLEQILASRPPPIAFGPRAAAAATAAGSAPQQ